jgi:hypothetical protein
MMIGTQSRLPARRSLVELFNWMKPCFYKKYAYLQSIHSHVHDNRHRISTSLSSCSTGRSRAFTKNMHTFKVFTHTSMIIGTQSRLPCRAVQLDEAVLLKNPVSPYEISKIIGEHTYEGKSKASASPTER